jgi:E3 ubiquitin-protein ligase HECTD1
MLIEVIRKKDTETLLEALEGGIDPNFVDDVGQTLLNWAAAFGTEPMVESLCSRGADPNRGRRSSSLHYAVSFGRAEVVKILLRCVCVVLLFARPHAGAMTSPNSAAVASPLARL